MDAVEQIIRGIQVGQRKQATDTELSQRQQQIDSEAESRKAQIEFHKKELENQTKFQEAQIAHQGAQLDLAKKAANMEMLKNQQLIAQHLMQGGEVPGDVKTPVGSGTGGAAFSPVNPSDATSVQHSIPMGEGQAPMQMSLPTPEAFAKRQANLEEILAAPKRATEEAKQKSETERMLSQIHATQTEETLRQQIVARQAQEFETKREAMRIAGENYRNSVTSGTQMKIAQLPYQFFNNMDPQSRAAVVQPSVDAMNNGMMSASQVQKEFNEKGMQGGGMAVIGSFMKSGGVPPTDNQVKFNTSIKPVIDTLPLIQEYINELPKTGSGPAGLISGVTHPDVLNPKLDALYKQIEFNIATVAKNLSGDQGQRLQKALLEPAAGGFLPSKYKATSVNVSNFNKLMGVIESSIDSNNGSMPPQQRAHIKEVLGLTKISPLTNDGKPLSQPQPQPQQSKQGTWTPQGVQWQNQ